MRLTNRVMAGMLAFGLGFLLPSHSNAEPGTKIECFITPQKHVRDLSYSCKGTLEGHEITFDDSPIGWSLDTDLHGRIITLIYKSDQGYTTTYLDTYVYTSDYPQEFVEQVIITSPEGDIEIPSTRVGTLEDTQKYLDLRGKILFSGFKRMHVQGFPVSLSTNSSRP